MSGFLGLGPRVPEAAWKVRGGTWRIAVDSV